MDVADVKVSSGRGRDVWAAGLEPNETNAWRWDAQVHLHRHPQLERGAKEMGTRRRRPGRRTSCVYLGSKALAEEDAVGWRVDG